MKREMKFLMLVLFVILGITACGKQKEIVGPEVTEGVHLFVGQDLGAVGGLDDYSEGYIDYFGMPQGVTTYTNISDMSGINEKTNYGAGDICAREYLEDEDFEDTWLAIGIYMVNMLDATLVGNNDADIQELADFIIEYENPVFLRIGYEFDGSWNHYDPEKYKETFIYICEKLDEAGVENYVTVWQSAEVNTKEELLQWYPGDEYVDYCGYSYFDQENIGVGMLEIARERGKPIMIAEVTPRRDLLKEDSEEIWESWYEGFFNHIEENKDVVKAISYINCRWRTQFLWKGQGWGDSRIQVSEYIAEKWLEEMQSGIWNYQTLIEDRKEYEMTEEDE